MPYVAVDKDGSEWVFDKKPFRWKYIWAVDEDVNSGVLLPNGAIKALIGYELKWENDAVALTEKLLNRD